MPKLTLKFNMLGIATFLILGGLGFWWALGLESVFWRMFVCAGAAVFAFVVSFVAIHR